MPTMNALQNQERLIEALIRHLDGETGNDASPVQLFQTHISWVIVAKDVAYKIKKAIRFDFLDFSSLELRRHYCLEELRLNRRLAPDIYLDVIAVTGSIAAPAIKGDGDAIEYAVMMRTFDQDALWERRLQQDSVSCDEVEQLARKLADFHVAAAVAPSDQDWGSPSLLQATAQENFIGISALLGPGEERLWLDQLVLNERDEAAQLAAVFQYRKASGKIRECHGDLHCGNILTMDNRVEVFDCIEFSESLRWIDVMNDLAFIFMELMQREKPALAMRLLNSYLERTGDYAGIAILHYYVAQRAVVRCKVALLRAAQPGNTAAQAESCTLQARQYLQYALYPLPAASPAILITHGFSGSGKSTFARSLSETVYALQIRSDVERKRMHDLNPLSRAGSLQDSLLYDCASTEATYARLQALAREIVRAGWPVIVDATFLEAWQRNLFRNLAAQCGVPFLILDIRASTATLRRRVLQREQAGQDVSDAGLAVLEAQLSHAQPLSKEEQECAVPIDMDLDLRADEMPALIVPVLERMQPRKPA